jgi:hypothetical protein
MNKSDFDTPFGAVLGFVSKTVTTIKPSVSCGFSYSDQKQVGQRSFFKYCKVLLSTQMFAACLWLTFHLAARAAARDSGSDALTPLPDDQPVGWQAGETQRGTWGIIISCLSTIFACTWSVQHPNVPGGLQDGKWSRRWRSFKWMIITILFPELIVIHAVFEFAMALEALRLMEEVGENFKLPWWLPPRRLPLLQRLSFLLKSLSCWLLCSSREQKAADAEGQPVEGGAKWTFTHCFFANMGGFYYEGKYSKFPLTALQMAKDPARFERPTITEEEIRDRSKQDWFAKVVAALQFLQLALSLIVRTQQGLAFSQLETITLGFAVCGVFIYLIYLYKPQKVETRTTLTGRSEPVQEESSQQKPPRSESTRQVPLGPLYFEKTYDSFWDVLMNEPSYADREQPKMGEQVPGQTLQRIPNDNIPISDNSVAHPGVFFLAFASGLFGAVHAIAWHFEFPSTVEKILWQTATVVAAASPVTGLVAIPFAQWTVSAGDSQLFMRNCLRLMREFSWDVSEKASIDRAYEKLEDIFAIRGTTGPEARQSYASIFAPEQELGGPSRLGRELLGFLKMPNSFAHLDTQPLGPHNGKEFIEKFQLLVNLMEGKESKKLVETAKTNVFPRKNLFPKAFNRGILYLTTFLYCLSRLLLLAVAFSSLRQMPKSVYANTPWTGYIPTLGSSR